MKKEVKMHLPTGPIPLVIEEFAPTHNERSPNVEQVEHYEEHEMKFAPPLFALVGPSQAAIEARTSRTIAYVLVIAAVICYILALVDYLFIGNDITRFAIGTAATSSVLLAGVIRRFITRKRKRSDR